MLAFRETGLHLLWIVRGQASTGDGFLSMNCASPFGHRRARAFTPSPITVFVSTFCDKAEKMLCSLCDEITDVVHKLDQLPWTVIDDDMEILYRFVSECMTVQHSWGRRWCKTGDVCKELSPDGQHKELTVFQPDTLFCRLGIDEKNNIWQILWSDWNCYVLYCITVYHFQVVLFPSMSSLCFFCLRSTLHFILTNMMYFNLLSHILLKKPLLNSGGRNSDSAW